MKCNRSPIILIIEFIHIFQYGTIFNKIAFSNINLLNKTLLIGGLIFLKGKIRKVFRQFAGCIEFKLSMSTNKEVFTLLTVLSLFGKSFLHSYGTSICSLK